MDFNLTSDTSTKVEPDIRFSKIIALYLIKFDVKVGNKIVWSKKLKDCDVDLNNVEFKALPSGIQDNDSSTVIFSHIFEGKIHYGLSRYLQKIFGEVNEDQQIDRKNIAMFSLGVLCDNSEDINWEASRYTNNGWEYIDVLDETLQKYIESRDYENYAIFEDLFDTITANVSLLSPNFPDTRNHLLNQMPTMFRILGPLVFPLFKLSLLRKRIMFFHRHGSTVDNFTLGAFTYLLLLLSIVPSNIKIHSTNALRISRPLFTIGLSDIEDPEYKESGSVCATNDEILMYQKDLYDFGVILPDDDFAVPLLVTKELLADSTTSKSSISSHNIKATLKDYHKFKCIYSHFASRADGFRDQESFSSENVTDLVQKDFGGEFSEPQWWLLDSTEPISWKEYIWSAFSWFASAGSVASSEDSNELCARKISLTDVSSTEELNRRYIINAIDVIGHFHQLTAKWFRLIDDIVCEELDDPNVDSLGGSSVEYEDLLADHRKITIEITYQEILEMELDPYSESDLEFVKQFVLLYWSSIVDHVEIGIGIHGVCC